MLRRLTAILLLLVSHGALAEVTSPSLIVSGHGQARAAPDRARLAFGVVAQAEEAAAAQAQVNRAMNRALQALRELGLPERSLGTAGITVMPVFQDWSAPRQQGEARIVGYRASNRLQVQLDQVARVGAVIDAAIAAGANQVDSLEWGLRDETVVRGEALRRAVRDARARAESMAEALRMRIAAVEEVREEGMGVIAPRRDVLRALGAGEAGTPITEGEVQVEANVQIRYRMEPLLAGP